MENNIKITDSDNNLDEIGSSYDEQLKLLRMKKIIDVAQGYEPADVVFKNATYFNPFTKSFLKGDIAVSDGYIAGIGEYEGKTDHNLEGSYITSGLIDSHMHLESSMVTPGEYAKAVLPRGVTTVIADPHEVANVAGLQGIKFLMDQKNSSPLDIRFMLPSCVPSSPQENSGASLSWDELETLLENNSVSGLGEMMDFPAVLNKDEDKLTKLINSKKYIIDGHAPLLSGKGLNAYIAAGVSTDHECSTNEEMEEKLRLGMRILVREGTGAKNALTLLDSVNEKNMDRILFCTDDCHPSDLLRTGTIDNIINMAISKGFKMEDALLMATYNPAIAYGLDDKGAIAPGYRADFVVFKSLDSFKAEDVFVAGELVSKSQEPLWKTENQNSELPTSINLYPWKEKDLEIEITESKTNIMGIRENDLTTDLLEFQLDKGIFKPSSKYSKLLLMERHHGLPLLGKTIMTGYGITDGAIATTVAHDAHNLIIAGDNDEDMILAMEEIKKIKGGLVLASKGKIIGTLPLPLFGLITPRDLHEVSEELEALENMAHDKLLVNPNLNPFLQLSFLALPVIPDVKLTCKGLYSLVQGKYL